MPDWTPPDEFDDGALIRSLASLRIGQRHGANVDAAGNHYVWNPEHRERLSTARAASTRRPHPSAPASGSNPFEPQPGTNRAATWPTMAGTSTSANDYQAVALPNEIPVEEFMNDLPDYQQDVRRTPPPQYTSRPTTPERSLEPRPNSRQALEALAMRLYASHQWMWVTETWIEVRDHAVRRASEGHNRPQDAGAAFAKGLLNAMTLGTHAAFSAQEHSLRGTSMNQDEGLTLATGLLIISETSPDARTQLANYVPPGREPLSDAGRRLLCIDPSEPLLSDIYQRVGGRQQVAALTSRAASMAREVMRRAETAPGGHDREPNRQWGVAPRTASPTSYSSGRYPRTDEGSREWTGLPAERHESDWPRIVSACDRLLENRVTLYNQGYDPTRLTEAIEHCRTVANTTAHSSGRTQFSPWPGSTDSDPTFGSALNRIGSIPMDHRYRLVDNAFRGLPSEEPSLYPTAMRILGYPLPNMA